MKYRHVHPNFFIAGAPKCGTTALWGSLKQHPDIYLTKTYKEPNFFTRVEGELKKGELGAHIANNTPLSDRCPQTGAYHLGREWYARLFDDWDGEAAVGEASTLYFHAEDAVQMIAEHVPNAKLVFMLRDPVARLYSHYWHEHRIGFTKKQLPDFYDMVESNHVRLSYYCRVSHYKSHLNRFFQYFAQDRIKIFLLSDLKTNPDRVLSEACTFLGVDDGFTFALGKDYNPHTVPRFKTLHRGMARVYGAYYSRVGAHLPPRLRIWSDRIKDIVRTGNTKAFSYPPIDPKIRAELLPRFEEDITFVEDLLGVNLDAWRTRA